MDRYQLAAARGMLGWTLKELSEKTNITIEAINKFERGEVDSPRKSTIEAIRAAFESEGIEFIDQSGVRFKDNSLIEYEGPDAYQQLMEHACATLKNKEGEIWILFGEDSKSTQEVVDREVRLRKINIKMRFVISDSNDFLRYPLQEYRMIPNEYFHNNPILIYEDCVAIFYPNENKSEIRKHAGLAACMRSLAKLVYANGHTPNSLRG